MIDVVMSGRCILNALNLGSDDPLEHRNGVHASAVKATLRCYRLGQGQIYQLFARAPSRIRHKERGNISSFPLPGGTVPPRDKIFSSRLPARQREPSGSGNAGSLLVSVSCRVPDGERPRSHSFVVAPSGDRRTPAAIDCHQPKEDAHGRAQ
jgi:hypothetical protein